MQDLLTRIRRNAYQPQASRLLEIPKEDGSMRPLAIFCFEDKIVQQAVSTILTAVYGSLFLTCSYGYREGVNGHEALKALMKYSNQNPDGATLEIDLRKYFNSIPHVIDGWFAEISQSHLRGRAEMVRFADDMVFVFQSKADADRFYPVLPKRLEKYGLTLHADKSSLIRSGRKVAEEAEKRGERIPVYKFLGFTCYWGKSRAGWWRLKYKSRSDRLAGKLKGLRKYLRESRSEQTGTVLQRVKKIVTGWVNYQAISDNQHQVSSFILLSKRALFSGINRKGGNRKMNWMTFGKLLKRINYPQNFKTTSMFATC